MAESGEVVVVPRTSRYRIELTVDERAELERRAQTPTLPFRDVRRARLILLLARLATHAPQLRLAA
jgi:hypothetical protein